MQVQGTPSDAFDPTQILAEDLLTLEQAAREIPRPAGRKPIHYSSLWRWAKHGVRGHKLQTIKIGQQHFTSRQRLHAFLEATN